MKQLQAFGVGAFLYIIAACLIYGSTFEKADKDVLILGSVIAFFLVGFGGGSYGRKEP